MALLSPGVEVTIIDESNYLPAPTNSVPFILIATAQNKISGSGVGVAAGTTEVNANRVYLISSQRDLVNTFGNPFFYKTTAGMDRLDRWLRALCCKTTEAPPPAAAPREARVASSMVVQLVLFSVM